MVGPVWDQLSAGRTFVSPYGHAEGPADAPGRRCPGPRLVRAGWDHAPSLARTRGACWSGGDLGEHGSDGKATAEVHDYHDELTGVLASSLAKRAPGYTSLGFPDPRKLPYTPSASTASPAQAEGPAA